MTNGIETSRNENIVFDTQPTLLAGLYVFLPSLIFFWLVAPLFIALFEYFRIKNIRYVITDQRVICEKGVFGKVMDQIEMYRIRDLRVTRSFFERIFNVGSVEIISNDKTDGSFIIRCIPNPVGVKEHIRNRAECLRNNKRRIV